MFSLRQKQEIAEKVEEILLSYNHPEMPKTKPIFHLQVIGNSPMSWADIEPNWMFEDGIKIKGLNPWNELQDMKFMGEVK